MSIQADIIVLGAGLVGVSTALHLQRSGRSVLVIDRREPGEETSYGNAGVIEGGTYVPIAFPRNPLDMLRYATNLQPALHFHTSFLPRLAPWLLSLARQSSEARLRDSANAIMSLTVHAIDAHKALLGEAGARALLRDTGWLRLYRSAAQFEADRLEMRLADETGFGYSVLAAEEAREVEPHLGGVFHKAVLWHSISSVSDPGAATMAVAGLFRRAGGEIRRGEVRRLVPARDAWEIETDAGTLRAGEVVVALGPWSMDVLRPLGYRFPFAVKRGYHQHFAPLGNAGLSRPVVDCANGYVLAPMAAGIRLTTGIEFADRDAPATPVQVGRAERHARELFPLGDPVEPAPWMGRRPCFPDSCPVIGAAPDHRGLWLNFGHAHLGFTLGPVSGRLLAELMTGAVPLADPAPFSARRF